LIYLLIINMADVVNDDLANTVYVGGIPEDVTVE